MYPWIVTIPTIRTVAAGTTVCGSQTLVVHADRHWQARDLALSAAATDQAARRRRGALLDTAGVDVARWRGDGFSQLAC
ncbi:hypothetical protein [Streptomyces griseochromogenes]|uniref:hypothetical protein n=1 Tax=Streptomyces griseochromogenes TaxID=68214 RepID=UPI0037B11D27